MQGHQPAKCATGGASGSDAVRGIFFQLLPKRLCFHLRLFQHFHQHLREWVIFWVLMKKKKIRPIRVAGVSDWVQFVSVFSNFYFSKHIWQQNRRKMMKNKTVWMIVKQFNNFSCYSGGHKSRVISNALLYTVNNIVTTHVWYITF